MARPNLPALQFYGGDWRKDPGVQALNYFDRGVWFEMLLMMHESEDRGKLVLNNRPIPDDALARMLGLDLTTLQNTLRSIFAYRVADRDSESGAIMNRRMVRDEAIRRRRSESGKLGGNPNLRPRTARGSEQTGDQEEVSGDSSVCLDVCLDGETVADRAVLNQTPKQNDVSGNGGVTDLNNYSAKQNEASGSNSQDLLNQSSKQETLFGKSGLLNQKIGATSSSSLGSQEPVKPNKQVRGRSAETWIDPLWVPSAEQYAKLEAMAVEYWPEMSSEQLLFQIEKIRAEFVDYWLEQARIDKQNPGLKASGKKASWYMTFRNRLQAVGVAVQRRRAAAVIQQRQNQGAHDDPTTGQRPYESAAERNERLLREQEEYLNGLQGGGGSDTPPDAVGLQLDPEDFE